MLFSQRLSLANLIDLSRGLRLGLGAGISARDVFSQQATRGPRGAQPVAGRIYRRLARGASLEAALADEKKVFPPLFVTMAVVGEQTGHLPEIFQELEKHYQLQYKLRRQFLTQSFLPMLQFIIALFIVAIVIFFLGQFSPAGPGPPRGLFGLSGLGGAAAFLAIAFGGLILLYLLYLGFQRVLRSSLFIERLLLQVPILGPCLRAFALARLALALRLTLDSDLPIASAARLSFEASGNLAIASLAERVVKTLKAGDTLTAALAPLPIFPQEFKNLVSLGEEGGNLPEVLDHHAGQLYDDAKFRLTALTKAAGILLWVCYAGFMALMIFSLAGMYIRMFDLGVHAP